MPSPHRFLSNHRNAAAMAAVTASSILPADATAFPLQRSRQGTARAVLTGGYTGAEDTTVEIEIVSDAGTGLLSEPVFTGAGNGALSALAATGVPSQSFTLLLASLGTATKAAAADFYGVKLQAKATGAAGNGIEITVDRTGIVATPTLYSFLEAVKAGDSEHKGPEWDFGSYALTADGELDARTARLRFGNDPQVYRQYKTFVDGQWTYILDPPIVRDLPAETPVYALSGACGVTVTAGATVETYPSIITLFDLLNALKTRSNLIDVAGVVIEDQTPGGMAVDELPLRTDAYALPASYSGNAAFPGMGAVTVPPTAPTEIITLECFDIAVLGGERWTAKGRITGLLPDSTTGAPYTARGYGWTIPKLLATGPNGPGGKIYVKDISFAARPAGARDVELCVKPLIAGAEAKAKTIELIYSRQPSGDCPCDSAPARGFLSEQCLGVHIDGATTMTIAVDYQTRLVTLYAWREGFIASNTEISNTIGVLRTAFLDVTLANKVTQLFADALKDLFLEAETPEAAALARWDAAQTAMATEIAVLAGIATEPNSGVSRWSPSASYSAGTDLLPPRGRETGHTYRIVPNIVEYTATDGSTLLAPGISFSPSEDVAVWPTDGGSVTINGYATFLDAMSNTGLAKGTAKIADLGPYGAEDNALTGGAETLQHSVDAFVQRYESAMDHVRALAGIVPKSDAGSGGSDCWQPCDGAYEWRVNGMEYLPACTNVPYHSSVKTTDAKGREAIWSTQEFGFIIRCACPERLMEGDRITLVIENDAQPPKTYAVGDTIKIPVIAAQALELAGGQDGNDTLTWTVRGSAGASWPDYVAPIGAEPLYDQAGLQFRATPGGVAFALGDQFQFDVAGGTWRWRRDGGAWSAAAVIAPDPTDLADGVQLTFRPGPAPAFVAGDAWAFAVMQPHAPKRAIAPDRGAWRWSDNGGDWQVTFPAETPITAIALWHTCPGGTVFTATGFDAAAVPLWSRVLPYRPGLTVQILEEAAAVAPCHMLQITVANAPGGSLRWCWCGVPWSPQWPLAAVTLRETWQMQRGVQSARLIGRGGGGEIAWSLEGEGWLNSQDWADLLTLLESLKAEQDAPFVFVPDAGTPSEARLVRIGADDLDLSDVDDFQNARRLLSVRVPLASVSLA